MGCRAIRTDAYDREPSATAPDEGPADGDDMQTHSSPPKKRTQPADALTYTVGNACALSGLGRTKIFELLRDGTLRRIKVGDRTLIGGASFRALLGAEVA